MLVDAPMTPPTSPLPQEIVPTQVPIPSQSGQPQALPNESVDPIMELQNLQLTQSPANRMDTPSEQEWQSSDDPTPPLKSLEEESNRLVPTSKVKLSDFDVVETLGKSFQSQY